MARYELYWYPGTCARVPFVALEEIGAPFAINVVDLLGDKSYAAVNPKEKVPALISNGAIVTENPVLLKYLSERHPDAGLLPLGDENVEREAEETMAWFAAGIHPIITRLRFPQFFSDNPIAQEDIKVRAASQLEGLFDLVEQRLKHDQWLFGDWTIVDVYLLWLWFRATGSGMDGSSFPLCAGHATRCEARPTVAKVLDREEQEFRRFRTEGKIPDDFPAYQAGRAPTFP